MPRKAKNNINSTVSAAAPEERALARADALKPEDKAAQKAIVISDEATRLAVITDLSSETAAVEFLRDVLARAMEEVSSLFDSIVKSAKETYDAARKQRDKSLEPFESAKKKLLGAIVAYRTKLQKDTEKARLAAALEQSSQEKNAAIARAAEEAKLQAQIEKDLAELPDDATDDLIERVMAPLEAFRSQAEAVHQVAPQVVVTPPEMAAGVIVLENWGGEVTDAYAVLKQIVEDKLPLSLVEFKDSEINRLAKLYKDTRAFPGLKFEPKPFAKRTGR